MLLRSEFALGTVDTGQCNLGGTSRLRYPCEARLFVVGGGVSGGHLLVTDPYDTLIRLFLTLNSRFCGWQLNLQLCRSDLPRHLLLAVLVNGSVADLPKLILYDSLSD